MGFIKKFFVNVFNKDDEAGQGDRPNSMSDFDMNAHLNTNTYGRFELTDAIRPSFDRKVVPSQGYRHDHYRDAEQNSLVPVLMASASRERLFDVFLELIYPLGSQVDVVLETSHDTGDQSHNDLYRENIDMPVLQSILWDHQDLLLNDGCTGIAVLNPKRPQEVQFDEHKLLMVYGSPLETYEHMLERNGVELNEDIQFITEAEHVHSSHERFIDEFQKLRLRLGIDE